MNIVALESTVLQGPFAGDAVVDGRIPPWLSGTLMRTALGMFTCGAWRAEHLFDGMGMLYSFRLQPPDRAAWQQRLLDCATNQASLQGRTPHLSFGTRVRRNLFRRLMEPVAAATDNANVNVQKLGADWVAMTETPYHLRIDPSTLQVLGRLRHTDDLPAAMTMLAHPHLDTARGELINVGTRFGHRSELVVFSRPLASTQRRIIARIPQRRVPYLHSFALTPNKVVLVIHPLYMNPLTVPWSSKGLIEHFRWQAELGTRLIVVDRATGTVNEHECAPFFAFHMANAFEDGADLVVDLVAYDDSRIAYPLTTVAALGSELPDLAPKLLRIRVAAGKRTASLERSGGDAAFEFPQINYRIRNGQRHRYIWGMAGKNQADGYNTTIVKADVENGEVKVYRDGWIYGEPVFVGTPGAEGEDDGVLLTVGRDPANRVSRLCVLTARSLEPMATATVQLPLPFGFHGGFSFS